MKDKSDQKLNKSLKNYISGIISSNFISANKIDKYFRYPITDSTAKAIKENWIRILGIDYDIISMNLCKKNKILGISLEGRNEINESKGIIQRHYLRSILPQFCIGSSHKFNTKDELLEINGLKMLGMPTKDVLRTLKKLTNDFQIVVARSMHHNYDMVSDYGGSEDNINLPTFYDTEDEEISADGTLRSVTSNYSTTSRDFGSSISVSGMIDGQYESVANYLKDIDGWRGPIVLEFRREIKSFGLALQEISDPKTGQKIIVFKMILPKSIADRDGRLHVGDRLLHVNGKSVLGVQFRKVCQWMKSAPGGRLVILICKPYFKQTDCDQNSVVSEEETNLLSTYDTNKLPKLSEEIETDNYISPAPEDIEKILILERKEDRLGIFFDIPDDGLHGCRIKKITWGLVRDNGTLQEGDYITKINGISLRAKDKPQLDQALRKISANKDDYKISYITAEDLKSYKSLNKKSANIYPKTEDLKLTETESQYSCEKADTRFPKWNYTTFDITIENDHCTKLGLVLLPSLNKPSKYISIVDIHENSLAYQSGLFQINDDILMVNGEHFQKISTIDAAKYLRQAMENCDVLNFKIGRLVESEPKVELKSHKFSQLGDIYLCSIIKMDGYGFSLLELEDRMGVIVENINLSSSASKVDKFKIGHRFAKINEDTVVNYPKTKIMQIVKDSTYKIDLVMEIPKFREMIVRITKDASLSFGLNIAGGVNTNLPMPIIESLVPDRMSKFTDELYENDIIMEVDGKKMIGLTHEQIIQLLLSTGPVSVFKICRKLPFVDREIFYHVHESEFPSEYLSNCKYSVRLNKPVDSISTFGITFTNVVILDQNDSCKVLGRYKAVLSIDKSSVTEKYAPEIRIFHYLISVNSVPVDCEMLCDDLKEIIDTGSRVDFVFSKDIPYNIENIVADSPVLLHENEDISTSDSHNIEDGFNVEPLVDVNIKDKTEDSTNEIVDHEQSTVCKVNDKDENVEDVSQFQRSSPELSVSTEKGELESCPVSDIIHEDDNNQIENKVDNIDSLSHINDEIHHDEINNDEINNDEINNDEINNDEIHNDEIHNQIDKESIIEKCEESVKIDEIVVNVDEENKPFFKLDENNKDYEDEQKEEETKSDKVENDSESDEPSSELGIDINYITIKKLPNVELGFQLFGGVEGGPNKENLPFFVVGSEKRTCNWPEDREEPYLKNGFQLIELNGEILSFHKLSDVENLINEADELKFKVVTFK